MGGEWRITQYAPGAETGVKVTVIPVVPIETTVSPTVAPPTDPFWLHDTMLDGPCLSFAWQNGREEYYPWASIIRAEWTPDPADDQ